MKGLLKVFGIINNIYSKEQREVIDPNVDALGGLELVKKECPTCKNNEDHKKTHNNTDNVGIETYLDNRRAAQIALKHKIEVLEENDDILQDRKLRVVAAQDVNNRNLDDLKTHATEHDSIDKERKDRSDNLSKKNDKLIANASQVKSPQPDIPKLAEDYADFVADAAFEPEIKKPQFSSNCENKTYYDSMNGKVYTEIKGVLFAENISNGMLEERIGHPVDFRNIKDGIYTFNFYDIVKYNNSMADLNGFMEPATITSNEHDMVENPGREQVLWNVKFGHRNRDGSVSPLYDVNTEGGPMQPSKEMIDEFNNLSRGKNVDNTTMPPMIKESNMSSNGASQSTGVADDMDKNKFKRNLVNSYTSGTNVAPLSSGILQTKNDEMTHI